MNDLSPLENFLAGGRKPSTLFGIGYNGPPKPSDMSTLAYLVGAIVAIGSCWWVVVFYGH